MNPDVQLRQLGGSKRRKAEQGRKQVFKIRLFEVEVLDEIELKIDLRLLR